MLAGKTTADGMPRAIDTQSEHNKENNVRRERERRKQKREVRISRKKNPEAFDTQMSHSDAFLAGDQLLSERGKQKTQTDTTCSDCIKLYHISTTNKTTTRGFFLLCYEITREILGTSGLYRCPAHTTPTTAAPGYSLCSRSSIDEALFSIKSE